METAKRIVIKKKFDRQLTGHGTGAPSFVIMKEYREKKEEDSNF